MKAWFLGLTHLLARAFAGACVMTVAVLVLFNFGGWLIDDAVRTVLAGVVIFYGAAFLGDTVYTFVFSPLARMLISLFTKPDLSAPPAKQYHDHDPQPRCDEHQKLVSPSPFCSNCMSLNNKKLCAWPNCCCISQSVCERMKVRT